MMFGEIDFAGKFSPDQIMYHGATEFLITFFIIFIGIIIMNFLIGLSIDNMTGLFQAAGVERLRIVINQVFYLIYIGFNVRHNLKWIQNFKNLGYDVGNNVQKILLQRIKHINFL